MLDPGALGTLIIRNDAARADAERVATGVPENVADGEPRRIRGVIASGLRRAANLLAAPEESGASSAGQTGVRSLGLTWTDL